MFGSSFACVKEWRRTTRWNLVSRHFTFCLPHLVRHRRPTFLEQDLCSDADILGGKRFFHLPLFTITEEQHRLYVGNLPYAAQKEEIEEVFNANSIPIKRIDISIDPFTGRIPSYCFVDFSNSGDAQKAMQSQYFQGRRMKLGQHTAKKRVQPVKDGMYAWDRYKRSDEAPSRLTAPQEEGRRLYIGGIRLPRIPDQAAFNALVRGLFMDWPVEAVSKLTIPSRRTLNGSPEGDTHYCFVDLPSAEIAVKAAEALNGAAGPNGTKFRIAMATRKLNKPDKPHGPQVEREQSDDRLRTAKPGGQLGTSQL